MSSSELEASVVSVPSTVSPPSTPKETVPDVASVNLSSNPDTSLDRPMHIKTEIIDEPSDDSPDFVHDASEQLSQLTSNAPPELDLPSGYSSTSFGYLCEHSRQTNLFFFTTDGSFTPLSPHHLLDMKDLDKGDATSVVLASRPLSTSSLSAGSTASPKPFTTLQLSEAKNDKMLSGYDSRADGLSPLSVITVSAYQEGGQPSPSSSGGGSSSVLSRSHPVLRYHPGGDTMLSGLNYSETEILQEGGFDVPSSSSFGSLDGLLNSGIGGNSGSAMRLPDLLDNEISQETYIDSGQDLQLSPQSFSTTGESFSVGDNTSLGSVNDSNNNTEGITLNVSRDLNKTSENGVLLVEKLKTRSTRPAKAISPSRQGTQPCPTCGKVFSNSSALTKHKLTHSDERKYICPLCAKAFKRQDHLNGHMLTHRNKKPYECNAEGCGKSYCDARSLRRHRENHHASTTTMSTTLTIPSLNKHMSGIPGLTHISNFNALQSSFPASVITSNCNSSFAESSTCVGNRIQYAPPLSQTATSLSAQTSVISTETSTRTSGSPVVGSIIPATASQLQFLAFHQTSSSRSSTQSNNAAAVVKADRTVLAPWPTQTINTGALLLAKSLEMSQRKPKSAQIITGTFGISSPDRGKTSTCISSMQSPSLLPEVKIERGEQTSLERAPSIESEDRLVENSFTQTLEKESCQVTSMSGSAPEERKFLPKSNSTHGRAIRGRRPSQPRNVLKKDSDGIHMESPLLQQLLNQQSSLEPGSGIPQAYSDLSFMPALSEQTVSPSSCSSQQSHITIPQWSQVRYTVPTMNRQFNSQDPKPVECSLCQRKFKNTPALNGHMRLHGGYFKKEGDSKRGEKKSIAAANNLSLTTASTNVRALIEEKINQKRNVIQTPPATFVKTVPSSPVRQVFNFQSEDIIVKQEPMSPFMVHQSSPIISPVAQESIVFNDFPITSPDSVAFDATSTHDNHLLSDDWLKKLDLKQQFRVPRPPGEKYRRHSDSDHFIPVKRPCTTHTNSALADLLRRKVVSKRASRIGSDPGEPLPFDALMFADLPSMNSSSVFDFLPKFASSASLQSSLEDGLPRDLTDPAASEDSVLPILSAEDIPDAQPAMDGMKDVSEIDSNCLDKNVFFDASNPPLPVVPSFPDISVNELEMMQLTNAVTAMSSLPCDVQTTIADDKFRIGEDSNDDDVFLSPTTLPTSPIKSKRKHKPEPLYIPPYVNTCGFTSRLRSPRLWDPSHPDHKKLSPPPYTPPPMLSPVRSGSGLFWHIITGSGSLTPKSAPITPSFGYPRKGSVGETVFEEEEVLSEAPESDILPHVNIGPYYQARLPMYNPNARETQYCKHRADKVWDPATMANLSDEEVDAFVELACSAAIPGGASNKEYAFHVLQRCKGKIQDAILALMEKSPKLPAHHTLLTFKYTESDKWSNDEIEAYHQGLLKFDKDFFSIAKDISTKTVKQCVQFYYLWKKVCPDEYKRIRLVRRRKEQESLYYNLRSKDDDEDGAIVKDRTQSRGVAQGNGSEGVAEKDFLCNGQGPLPPRSKTSSHSTITAYNRTSVRPPTSSIYEFPMEPSEEYPCKICGKIFSKVKSRSAHMKSHRPLDIEKRIKYES